MEEEELIPLLQVVKKIPSNLAKVLILFMSIILNKCSLL